MRERERLALDCTELLSEPPQMIEIHNEPKQKTNGSASAKSVRIIMMYERFGGTAQQGDRSIWVDE